MKSVYTSLLVLVSLTLTACGSIGLSPNLSSDMNTLNLSDVEKRYKAKPDDINNRLLYITALRQNDLLNKAAIIAETTLKDQPDNVPLMLEYAMIQLSLKNYKDAEHYSNKVIAIDTQSYKAYHLLGIALDSQDRHEEAEAAFREGILKWKGDPAPAMNDLALNLAAQEQTEQAIELLQRALIITPRHQELERNLRILLALKQSHTPYIPKPKPKPKPKPDPDI